MAKIKVLSKEITIQTRDAEDYVSLTDIARYKDSYETDDLIRNWLRNRNTIEFLGIWEQLNNPDLMVELSDKRIVLVETKGQEDLAVPLKMARRQWCEDINRVQADVAYDFVDVDEESFKKFHPTSFRQLLEGFKEYKGKI